MVWLYSILLWVGGGLGLALISLFSWAVCYDLFQTSLPPGFPHPHKLRMVHWMVIMMVTLGKLLELLSICKETTVIQFCISLSKTRLEAGVSSKDFCFEGIPVRVYQPKSLFAGRRRGFLFFHGGAGMFGTLDQYENICSKIAKESDSVVVSVDYRLAPEHQHPAQVTDCLTATTHFMQHAEAFGVDSDQIVVGGDSAGANYATVVAQTLTGRPDLPRLRAQVLFYGIFQFLAFGLPSYQQNSAKPPLFRKTLINWTLQHFKKSLSLSEDMLKGSHIPGEMRLKYGKLLDADIIPEKFKGQGYKRIPFSPFKPDVHEQLALLLHSSVSPLLAEDSVIQQLPETFIVSCEYDVLRDESLIYKMRLEQQGVKVSWFHAKQGFHGVLNFGEGGILGFSAALEIQEKVADFLKGL